MKHHQAVKHCPEPGAPGQNVTAGKNQASGLHARKSAPDEISYRLDDAHSLHGLLPGRFQHFPERDRLQNLQAPLTIGEYAFSSDFWNRTFQNWQSEFLAVGSMVVLSIYLRQRGSPESKPVGSPHTATGVEG